MNYEEEANDSGLIPVITWFGWFWEFKINRQHANHHHLKDNDGDADRIGCW